MLIRIAFYIILNRVVRFMNKMYVVEWFDYNNNIDI
jgi:hypothetical protein